MRTMKQGLRLGVAGVALIGLIALPACDGGADEQPPAEQPPAEPGAQPTDQAPQIDPSALPEGVTMEMVQQGQQVFTGQGNCFTCHDMDGTGTTLAPDLTDDEWINIEEGSYEEIMRVVQQGVAQPVEHPSPMPPMGGAQLSEEQVQSVAAYVYALSHGG